MFHALAETMVALLFCYGNSPFTYAWSNGAVSQSLVNVAASTYTVTVTDNSNCQAVVSKRLLNQ
ncbi:MAG: hypothetical protein R2847_03515 [Bacteroidia bacterium]